MALEKKDVRGRGEMERKDQEEKGVDGRDVIERARDGNRRDLGVLQQMERMGGEWIRSWLKTRNTIPPNIHSRPAGRDVWEDSEIIMMRGGGGERRQSTEGGRSSSDHHSQGERRSGEGGWERRSVWRSVKE
jgi:hypothetical protein